MKQTFNVKGMHCPSCEILVKDSLEETKGVIKAEISHSNGKAIVEFDNSHINADNIKDIIKKEGYEVE